MISEALLRFGGHRAVEEALLDISPPLLSARRRGKIDARNFVSIFSTILEGRENRGAGGVRTGVCTTPRQAYRPECRPRSSRLHGFATTEDDGATGARFNASRLAARFMRWTWRSWTSAFRGTSATSSTWW